MKTMKRKLKYGSRKTKFDPLISFWLLLPNTMWNFESHSARVSKNSCDLVIFFYAPLSTYHPSSSTIPFEKWEIIEKSSSSNLLVRVSISAKVATPSIYFPFFISSSPIFFFIKHLDEKWPQLKHLTLLNSFFCIPFIRVASSMSSSEALFF